MRQHLYAFRDNLTGYKQPFIMPSTETAKRIFRQMANDQNTEINQYAENYELWDLGEYDDQTGYLIQDSVPEYICKALDYKKE